MKLRLSLPARVMLIFVVALIAVWLLATAAVFEFHDWGAQNARPPARQIAALVENLERMPHEQSSSILEIANSNTLTARLENVQQGDQMPDGATEASPAVRSIYAAALGDRRFTISSRITMPQRFPRFGRLRNAIELRIALKTGETLIVDSTSPLPVNRVGLPIGFGAGLLGTLVALVALLIMNREMRPLSRLAAAVDQMDLVSAPAQLPYVRASAPEIQALIAAYNRLQGRLSQLMRARMAMLGGIAHDVRSFATRLRLRVDSMAEGIERERAISDITDMIHLLDDSVLASRAGAGELDEELLEFVPIARAEVEDRRAAGAKIDLCVCAEAEGATVLGDRLAVRRIVANLADNALKYGHAAHLSVEAIEGFLLLTVDDEGPGIPVELRDILLEPFVRLESSRNRRTGGAGLGLAIVRNLVEICGGAIVITDAPSGGARFTVRLPVFRSA